MLNIIGPAQGIFSRVTIELQIYPLPTVPLAWIHTTLWKKTILLHVEDLAVCGCVSRIFPAINNRKIVHWLLDLTAVLSFVQMHNKGCPSAPGRSVFIALSRDPTTKNEYGLAEIWVDG